MPVERRDRPDLAAVADLRREVAKAGTAIAHVDDETILDVIAETGDYDLAVTAFTMRPRPDWVAKLAGEPVDA